jgi:integrase/recombinase XerC
MSSATEDELATWWESLDEFDVGTRNVYLSHVAGFYRWLIREHLRVDDPTVRIMRPRKRRLFPRPIRDEHLKRALSLAQGDMLTWLLLAVLEGMRACEIAVASREHVNGDVMLVTGKGGKQRIVPLHHDVAAVLARYPSTGPLFPGATPLAVSQRANLFLHDVAGVPETLHQLRHHFGTNLYKISRDLRLVQDLMGHADPRTTAGYAAWDQDSAAVVVGRLQLPA